MDLAQSFGLAVIDAAGRDASGNPVLEEGESIQQTFDDVQLVLGSSSDQKSGKLSITEGYVTNSIICMLLMIQTRFTLKP
jgi:hypothetical protein